MNAKKIIGKDIIQALQVYKEHRDNQDTIPWDKPKDVDNIFDLWKTRCENKKVIWGAEAIAGTFWFTQVTKTKQITIEANADRYWQPKIYKVSPVVKRV